MEHPTKSSPESQVDIDAALSHLAKAGITAEVLTESGVDITDLTAMRGAVSRLLLAAVGETSILDAGQLHGLEEAYRVLNAGADPGHLDELSSLIDTFVTTVAGRPVVGLEVREVPVKHTFGGLCLEAD